MHWIDRFLRHMAAKARFSPEQLRDLVTATEHSPHVRRHRASLIISRVQLISAVFAVLTPLWIVIDLAVFPWPIWGVLALIRAASAAAFVALAWPWRGLESMRTAYVLMELMLAIPPVFYLLSLPFLADAQLTGIAAIVAHGYGLLPFVVVAGLAVFPLTMIEVTAFTVPVIVVSVIGSMQMPAFDWQAYAGTLWLLVLVGGVALVSGASQLQYMIALVNRASHDGLTGALSRRTGTETIDLTFRIAAMHDQPLSVAFIDLDHFKQINDVHGHESGDAALRQAADALRQHLRRGDSLIRWGGEEFVLLLANTDMDGARLVIDRLRTGGLGPRPDGAPLTASIGVAERQADDAPDWPHLVELADQRMYRAKNSGRNRSIFDGGLNAA